MTSAISSPPAYSRFPSNPQTVKTLNSPVTCLKSINSYGNRAVGLFLQKKSVLQRRGFRCNCSSTPPGENESKEILDAFFLGKAFAEALNERIESTVGEFLSTVGRLQAEQQRQVQEFQDDVLGRAKAAQAKAAREAMEAQGLVPKSGSNISSSTPYQPETTSATFDEPTNLTSSSSSGSKEESPDNGSSDPPLEISIDD